MTDVQYLEKLIKESGKKREYLAEKLGLSRQSFSAKCNGKSEFNATQMRILCEELKIVDLEVKEAVFFTH